MRLFVCIWFVAFVAVSLGNELGGMGADDAMARLLQGNARFVAGKSSAPHGSDLINRRKSVTNEQQPFAVILSCSDSRVPPEAIFDTGLGDIFVVRTAGEALDNVDIGSIEYAVEHLGTKLIVVLGHQRCGAVSAAVSDAHETGNILDVLKAISPAVEETKGKPGDPIDNAVRANALDTAKHLESAPGVIGEQVRSGNLKIVAGRYDLDTGKVELLKSANNGATNH